MDSPQQVYACSSCSQNLLSDKYSKSTMNKLQHKKLNLNQIICILCSNLKENLQKLNSSKLLSKNNPDDPSLTYIRNPLQAPIIKEAQKYFSSFCRFKFITHMDSAYHWRTSAKLCVRNNPITGIISIGLFKPGTHEVIPCMDSVVHHPSINIVANIVHTSCCILNVEAYSEISDSGLIKYLLFSVERSSKRVQLTIVWNSATPSNIASTPSLLLSLADTILSICNGMGIPNMIHSIWVNYHMTSPHENTITGRDEQAWMLLRGSTAMPEEHIDTDITETPPTLFFPHTVFRQANIDGFSQIVREIRRWVPQRCRCVELYAGVGTIGLNLLDRLEYLHCSDENPNNKKCFDTSLKMLPPYLAARGRYSSMSAANVASQTGLRGFDLLIIDPPRKGLDDDVLNALLDDDLHLEDEKTYLHRVIYVSCGFRAFIKDCNMLLGSTLWLLIHAEGHVLFPGSDHIEVLAVFDRNVEYL